MIMAITFYECLGGGKTMTFNTLLLGVLVLLFSQGALATKQVITCEQNVKIILFGLNSIYGEVFQSGLLATDFVSTQATLSSQKQEESREISFYSGRDYDGNFFAVAVPEDVVGKSADAFPLLAT